MKPAATGMLLLPSRLGVLLERRILAALSQKSKRVSIVIARYKAPELILVPQKYKRTIHEQCELLRGAKRVVTAITSKCDSESRTRDTV